MAKKRAAPRLEAPGIVTFTFPPSMLCHSSGGFRLEVPSGGIVAVNPGTRLRRHKHLFAELHYVHRGRMASVIGRRTVRLGQGDLLFVNASDAHEHQAVRRCEVWYLALMISQYQKDGAPELRDNPVLALLSMPSRAIGTTASLQRLLSRVVQTRGRVAPRHRGDVSGAFIEFMRGLGRLLHDQRAGRRDEFRSASPHVSEPARRTVAGALKYIEAHHTSALSVADIARHVSVSQRQLERLVKSATGSTPRQHLMEERLRNAMKLLSTTALKIDAVMAQSGFRSRGHFYRYFSERIGTSPENFRRNSAEHGLPLF